MLQRYQANNTKPNSVSAGVGLEQIESERSKQQEVKQTSINPEIKELKDMQMSIQQQLHEMQTLLYSKFGHSEQMQMGSNQAYNQTGN